MLFDSLRQSAALQLDGYADIDHFRESEKYAKAQSIPLNAHNVAVLRASLVMPACTLSLVRTFPRIVNGYDLSGRLLIVIPMNEIASARINGEEIGQSLIMLKGGSCTVVEPEGRLVAILSIQPEALDGRCQNSEESYLLANLTYVELTSLKAFIRYALEFAAYQPESILCADVLERLQFTILEMLARSLDAGIAQQGVRQRARAQYLRMIQQVDALIGLNPLDTANEKLAEAIGVSLRTLQTASHAICGLPVHRYSRLRRLWSMRRQLRTGAPGMTVRASALAHGFWHMGELSQSYRAAFGELPSQTLEQARS